MKCSMSFKVLNSLLKENSFYSAAHTVFLSSVELLIDCGRERPKALLRILTKTDKHF